MISLFFFSSLVLGTIIGSFLNVVALRYGTQKTLGGRSSCMSCSSQLSWFELLPVVSFFALSGKCRKCKSKISIQYPIVEITCGFLFMAVFLKFIQYIELNPMLFITLFALVAAVFSILMVIVVYDIKHKMIPDGLVFTFALLSLALIALQCGYFGAITMRNVIDFAAGPLLAIPFWLLWAVSRGRWIGFGDAKLALGIGWFLGLAGGVSAVALGFWIGAVVSVAMLIASKYSKKGTRMTRTTEIPFAPFLVIGVALVFFFNFDFFYIREFLTIYGV